jgi:hypothetical protein
MPAVSRVRLYQRRPPLAEGRPSQPFTGRSTHVGRHFTTCVRSHPPRSMRGRRAAAAEIGAGSALAGGRLRLARFATHRHDVPLLPLNIQATPRGRANSERPSQLVAPQVLRDRCGIGAGRGPSDPLTRTRARQREGGHSHIRVVDRTPPRRAGSRGCPRWRALRRRVASSQPPAVCGGPVRRVWGRVLVGSHSGQVPESGG